MLKLLAQFFSTLAGTHDHAGITHTEHEQLKKALEANKTIVAQQLESLKDKDVEIAARVKEKEHLVKQLERAVKETDSVKSELVDIKDALREAQNDDVDATMVRTLNAQLRKEVGELKEEQTQAIKMLNSFDVELRKN